MSEWRKVELGEVITLQRGYDLPQRDRQPGDIPVVSSSGISGFHNEAKTKAPGVVTGRYGTLGEAYYIEQDFWPHNTTLFVKNFHSNHPRFVYYLLGSLNLSNRSAVSAVPGLNRNDLHRLPVMLPPLPTQRRIAQILGRLDDKIEVNRRINRTLEAMAQALYRHHFVEFGPYQDGSFVDSELGSIPEGWVVGKLQDVAQVNPDSIRMGQEPEEIVYVDISSVSTGRIDEYTPMFFADAPSRARRLVKHGDMIIAAVRPNRRSFALIQHPQENLVVSTGFGVIRSVKLPYTYTYTALSTQDFTDYLTLRATGAAYPAVNTKDFETAPMLIPPEKHLAQFHQVTEPWFEQQYVLEWENRKLAEIRDYLLPRLLSGEIEVDVG